MKLISYYAIHTFINGIKKLFKTWIAILILVCFVIGFGGGLLLDKVLPEEEIDPGAVSEVEMEIEDELNIVEKTELLEVVALGIIVLIIVLVTMNADKNGAKIFQMADVNLLFSSPLKPQFVLLFRTISQLLVLFIAGIYIAFQFPALKDAGFSNLSLVGLMTAYVFTLFYAELLNILIYVLVSNNGKLKKYTKAIIFAIPIILLASYAIYYLNTKPSDLLLSLNTFFNAKFTRFIPIFGNLKGIFYYGLVDNVKMLLFEIVYAIIGIVGLIYLIWHIDCDFYEEALARSEETYEMLRSAQETGFVKKTGKERSEKIKRDGFKYGSGANVFFFKEMYNRFRFAKLKVFTKTTITYLFVSIPLAVFLKIVTNVDPFMVIAFVIAGFAFYRSLGDSIEDDVTKSFFIMIPESTGKKMFYSILSGVTNCALDILPSILIVRLLSPGTKVSVIVTLLLIVSLDLYSASVGTFLGVSTENISTGAKVKQLIQILFIYFGLIPDLVVILVLIYVFEFSNIINLVMLITTGVNILLSIPFLLLAPLFIEPKMGKKNRNVNSYSYEER